MIAVVFAVGVAFATEAIDVFDTAYYDDPNIAGIQEVSGIDCPETGTITCKYNGFDLYAEQTLETPLYERP